MIASPSSSGSSTLLNLLPSHSSSSHLLGLPYVSLHPNVSYTSRKLRFIVCSGGRLTPEEAQASASPSMYIRFLAARESTTGRRREALLLGLGFAATTFAAVVNPSFAENDFQVYKDDDNKFQISIPQEWQVATGEPNGFKSVTAFYPEEQSSATTNVSVVITGLGPDFTRIESFGKVEEFAETLVGGLDRSWQKPPGVKAKLIDCKASKGLYYIEYSLQNPGESRKHLYTALGMTTNGWYNRLYTVTGQFVDEESSQSYGSKIQKVVSSFKFT
ncbi:PsbP domain-containing protein 3, chloroplastic [Linum perenne]